MTPGAKGGSRKIHFDGVKALGEMTADCLLTPLAQPARGSSRMIN